MAQKPMLPSPFHKPAGCIVWHGVGCQIRRQAGHGAAHSLATYLEAAELIPRLAEANAQILFLHPRKWRTRAPVFNRGSGGGARGCGSEERVGHMRVRRGGGSSL